MPDFGDDQVERSLQRLRALEARGRDHARALPADRVRALAERRHRRRVTATVVAASVVLALFAGGALTATEQLQGVSEHQPVDAVTPELPRSVLLRAQQTVYHDGVDFVVTDTVHGEGDAFVSVCQRAPLSALGAVEVWRRDFALRGSGRAVLRSAAMQFRSEAAASQASQTLSRWADDCGDAVASAGFEQFSDKGRWFDVHVSHRADAVGRFRTGMTYGPVPGDEFGEQRYFDDEGVVRSGNRIALVALSVPGQDWNWSYDRRVSKRTGLPLNPMFVTLEQAEANLDD